MHNPKRSEKHERQVQELRRSNAAGTHGESKYNRREKYPTDWLEWSNDEYADDSEYPSDDLDHWRP